jgi:hypothetical protein
MAIRIYLSKLLQIWPEECGNNDQYMPRDVNDDVTRYTINAVIRDSYERRLVAVYKHRTWPRYWSNKFPHRT